jgi:hypothetical protein
MPEPVRRSQLAYLGFVRIVELRKSSRFAMNVKRSSSFPLLPVRQMCMYEALKDLSVIRREQVNQFMHDDEFAQVL